MADTTIKKWNDTTNQWEELYPETTVSQLIATGDRDSTTFLRGDGVFSDTLTGRINFDGGLKAGSTANNIAPINIKSDSENQAIHIEGNDDAESWQIGVDTDGNLNFYNSGSTTPYVRFMDDNNVTISNTLTVGGLTGSNYNITGVNELQINDPGEGIKFKQGSSGDMTLAIVDDSNDNILRFSGTNAELQVGTKTVLTEETGAKRIDLSSQVQLSSYRKSVIALCNLDNTVISRNSWSGGTIYFHRTNGLHTPVTLQVTMEKRYNAQGANYTALVMSGNSFGDNIQYVQFDYNGTPYGGIEFYYNAAEHAQVYFIGETNFDIFGLDYYNTNTNTVLNSEVNNSISTSDMVAETDFYFNNNKVLLESYEGSGGGIDADTLDGINSTQFLRSDASDTMAGDYRIESGSFASLILDRGTTGSGSVVQFENNNGIIGGIGAYGDDGLQFRTSDGTQMVLDSSNRLGVGNLTPTERLDVGGNMIISGDNRYFTMGTPGAGTTTGARFLSIEGNTDTSGEGSGRIFFTEHNSSTTHMDKYGMSLGYRGGATSIEGASGNTWTGLSQIGNGQWGMWGHNNDATGALVMSGDRAATYVDFHNNDIRNAGKVIISDPNPILQLDDTGTTTGSAYIDYQAGTSLKVHAGSDPITFIAGNSEKARITAGNGYLGVGSTNPSYGLDVHANDGQIRAYGTIAKIWAEASDSGQASFELKNTEGHFRFITDNGAYTIYDQTDSSNRFQIDTSGITYFYNDIAIGNNTLDFNANSGNSTTAQIKGDRSNTDLDTRNFTTEGGFSYTTFDGSTSNKPSGSYNNANGVITMNTHSGAYNWQLAFTNNQGKMFSRYRNGGSYSSWNEMLTSASTIDADTLGGVAIGSLLQKSGGTMTGDVVLEKDGSTDVGSHGIVFQANTSLGGLGTFTRELNIDSTGNLKYNGNTIFHEGNDGSASGLHADLLDGQQGSYYLDYNNFTNTPSSGGVTSIKNFTNYVASSGTTAKNLPVTKTLSTGDKIGLVVQTGTTSNYGTRSQEIIWVEVGTSSHTVQTSYYATATTTARWYAFEVYISSGALYIDDAVAWTNGSFGHSGSNSSAIYFLDVLELT